MGFPIPVRLMSPFLPFSNLRNLCNLRIKVFSRKPKAPSTKGRTRVSLPALVAFKVALYRQMKAQGVNRAELARRLGWKLEQVARVLDPYHESKMSNMEMAFKTLGLEVDAKPRKAS